MIPRLTRRGAIELIGAGALAGLATPIVHAAKPASLMPPLAPVPFNHRIRRELLGDAAIVTERNFEIRFVPLSQGYRVEGEQVSSAIDAPPELAPLAEIWRKSLQTGLFPFELDAAGIVVSSSGPKAGPVTGLDTAIDVALAMLRDSGSSETQISDARGFMLWLQQAASEIGAGLPRDLFVPPAELQQASRVIELPGGGSGTIAISFQGTISPKTGLMQEARREIVTTTEGTSNHMLERWSLGLA